MQKPASQRATPERVAKLTGPLGWVLAAVAVAGAVYGIWWLLPLLPRRRKNDTPTA